jgi:hypothetical protein
MGVMIPHMLAGNPAAQHEPCIACWVAQGWRNKHVDCVCIAAGSPARRT